MIFVGEDFGFEKGVKLDFPIATLVQVFFLSVLSCYAIVKFGLRDQGVKEEGQVRREVRSEATMRCGTNRCCH